MGTSTAGITEPGPKAHVPAAPTIDAANLAASTVQAGHTRQAVQFVGTYDHQTEHAKLLEIGWCRMWRVAGTLAVGGTQQTQQKGCP
jgi:hypothetical protein